MSGHTDNSIWIDADIDIVWNMTNDLQAWPDMFTEYASVEILDTLDHTYTFRLTTHPDEKGMAWRWISERTLDPDNRRVRAHRVETGPFEYEHSEWTFRPEGSGTRMRWVQDFQMRPTAFVDDEHMTNRINAKDRREMAAIRAKVERAAAAGWADFSGQLSEKA